jgi:hypothetical protein
LGRECGEDAACMREVRCVEAKDHGRAGAARQRSSDTTWTNVRQPTQVCVVGGVPAMSGGRAKRCGTCGEVSGHGRPNVTGRRNTVAQRLELGSVECGRREMGHQDGNLFTHR